MNNTSIEYAVKGIIMDNILWERFSSDKNGNDVYRGFWNAFDILGVSEMNDNVFDKIENIFFNYLKDENSKNDNAEVLANKIYNDWIEVLYSYFDNLATVLT